MSSDRDRGEEITCLLWSKVKILKGKCLIKRGFAVKANIILNQALAYLGYRLSEPNFCSQLKSSFILKLQEVKIKFSKKKLKKLKESDALEYYEQLSICLSLLFIVFRVNL